MRPITWAILALLLPAAGCGSSPKTHFFTLDPVNAAQSSARMTGAPVQVVAVHIPAVLDRQQMVRRAGGGALDVSDQNRWSAPLGEMVRRVLTQDLAARLPAGKVIYPQQPAPRNTERIVLDILRFSGDGSGEVTFEASWTLLPSGSDTPLAAHHVRFTQNAGGAGYPGQARAMSAILGQLADHIAAALPAVPAQGGTGAVK